tara:strand:- start:331 stop:1863 length:1533 start_codon:yes stop_codon:yes gene_type:complete
MAIIPYIISTFRGGVSDETNKGTSGSFKHGHALNIHKRSDTLSCNPAMFTVLDTGTGGFSDGAGIYAEGLGTTLTGVFNFIVPSSDGSTYCFSSKGSIFTRSGDGIWTFSYNDANGNIKGAAEWTHDDGTRYMYWATDTSLARKEITGAEITSDSGTGRWTDVSADYRATLDGAEWHTMKNASGELMIANRDSLATVNFSGDFIAKDLNIRPGNLVKCLEERDDYAVLGSGRNDNAEEGHIWTWFVGIQNWLDKKKVPIKGVNALIDTELRLLQGGNDGEIFLSSFEADTTPLHAVPGGGEVQPEGVTVADDIALFGMYGGTYPGLWSFGRRRRNRPFSLNYEYRLAGTVGGSTISTIGAIAMINGELFASWGTTETDSSSYGVDQLSTTTKANAIYEGLEFDGGTPYAKKPFNTVEVAMRPLPASTAIAIRYRKDLKTTGAEIADGWTYAVTGANATSFSVEDATSALFSIGDSIAIYELGLELTASGSSTPEIFSITTYLSEGAQEYA